MSCFSALMMILFFFFQRTNPLGERTALKRFVRLLWVNLIRSFPVQLSQITSQLTLNKGFGEIQCCDPLWPTGSCRNILLERSTLLVRGLMWIFDMSTSLTQRRTRLPLRVDQLPGKALLKQMIYPEWCEAR